MKVRCMAKMELDMFPDYLNGYNGIFCRGCNVVFYAPKDSKIMELRQKNEACPICGKEMGLFWLGRGSKKGQPQGERYVVE